MSNPAEFYRKIYQGSEYGNADTLEKHPFAQTLLSFIREFELAPSRCIEIGSGRGAFQDVVADYTGVDYSPSVATYYRKPFVNARCEQLPFADNSFDAAWSYAVLEHVDDPQRSLEEIRRVLKPGGLFLLEPAWQCRPWAAEGYPVRPYSDFGLAGKLIKASIPLRNSLLFRTSIVFPRRIGHLLAYALSSGSDYPFRYRPLKANFDKFWMSDSDARHNMDPFDALLFFSARHDKCLNYQSLLSKLLVRTGPLVIQVCK